MKPHGEEHINAIVKVRRLKTILVSTQKRASEKKEKEKLGNDKESMRLLFHFFNSFGQSFWKLPKWQQESGGWLRPSLGTLISEVIA